MNTLILRPAYGRDYSSGNDVREAWITGKDFKICNENYKYHDKYCSVRDRKFLIQDGFHKVELRYAKLARLQLIDL